jgi:hypothetical protein
MTKSPKRTSPKRKSPKHKLPSTPAKELSVGQRKKGKDGKMYIVRIRSNGVHYWQKCGHKYGKKSGSHCRFIGPAQSPKRPSSPKKK